MDSSEVRMNSSGTRQTVSCAGFINRFCTQLMLSPLAGRTSLLKSRKRLSNTKLHTAALHSFFFTFEDLISYVIVELIAHLLKWLFLS